MSKNKGDLDTRMKEYEYVTRTYLTRRMPVMIRLDGKAFHTFTKGFNKPFDDIMIQTMQDTMQYLCENIEGCVLGYTQSDEITLVLCDYKKITSEAWFNNNVQKICSISASMATMVFNKFFEINVNDMCKGSIENSPYVSRKGFCEVPSLKMGMFDSRVWNIPKEEVNNCLVWRQMDATRNSIQSLAQSLYSCKQLEGVDTKTLQDKMFTEKGVNWNDLPTHLKRGSCCVKVPTEVPLFVGNVSDEFIIRNKWTVDRNIPIFSQDSDYVNSRIIFD